MIGTCLLAVAYFVHSKRPAREVSQPSPELVKATGKCAACHRKETSAIVHQFESSKHASVGVTCLHCHRPAEGQIGVDHKGFKISTQMTSKNCAQCHSTEYEQYERSRHAAPAWSAVAGRDDFTPTQLSLGEKYHKGAVDRPANVLAKVEGKGVLAKGCLGCHSIGKPNADGSFGSCTECHSRHSTSIALARAPTTCGQCHMGPDHSQIEIYNESKHGALFASQRDSMNLAAPAKALTTEDMPIPTCSTCHMSGLDGLKVTHDVTERLSWYLFAPVSAKRPGYQRGQVEMKEVCTKCHARSSVERFYKEAEVVVASTNEKIQAVQKITASMRAEGLLTPAPFDESAEFIDFDLWHYYGRTAKHGAFMGGADFVQWHGNYELLNLSVKLKEMREELRQKRSHDKAP